MSNPVTPTLAAELAARFATRATPFANGTRRPDAGLGELAARGLALDGDRAHQVALVRTVATGCATSAHALATQAVVADTLASASTDRLGVIAAAIRAGATTGVLVLPDTVDRSGAGTPSHITDGDTLVVSGTIRTRPDLDPTPSIVVFATVDPTGSLRLAALETDHPGVTVSTGTTSPGRSDHPPTTLLLDEVRIPADQIVADQLDTTRAAVHAHARTLRCAVDLGITDAALWAMGVSLSRANPRQRHQHSSLLARRLTLGGRITTGTGTEDLDALVVSTAALAREAVVLESHVVRGRGRTMDDPTARRLRELRALSTRLPAVSDLRPPVAVTS